MIARLRIVLAVFAGWLLGPADPHQCLLCQAVTPRLTGSQRAQIDEGREASCPWCNGPVWSTEFLAACRAPGGADRLLTDLTSKTAAPGRNPGRPTEQAAELEGTTAMHTSISREARSLRPGDIITREPDHDRPVQYRVTSWPKDQGEGVVLVDFTSIGVDPDTGRPTVVPGCGWWDARAALQIVPAHVQGGAA